MAIMQNGRYIWQAGGLKVNVKLGGSSSGHVTMQRTVIRDAKQQLRSWMFDMGYVYIPMDNWICLI